MQALHKETAHCAPDCQIRLGIATWDGGSKTAMSIKYAWPDKNGKIVRGGEFPVEALPQMLTFAIRNGFLSL